MPDSSFGESTANIRRRRVAHYLRTEPGAAVLLVAMGFDVLSMNAGALLKVKSVIRSISLEVAQDLLDQVMHLDDAQTIRSVVDLTLYNAGVDRLLRSSRTN